MSESKVEVEVLKKLYIGKSFIKPGTPGVKLPDNDDLKELVKIGAVKKKIKNLGDENVTK